jgi:hypothetical protein
MTAARAEEYRIIRQLVERAGAASAARRAGGRAVQTTIFAERAIAVLAATAGLFVLGSVAQELLWAAIAAVSIVALAHAK